MMELLICAIDLEIIFYVNVYFQRFYNLAHIFL